MTEPPAQRNGVVWAGSAWDTPTGPRAYGLVAFDLDNPTVPRTLPLDFFPHAIVPDPTAPHRAALFEKHGAGAALVDLAAMNVLRSLPTAPGRQFYGHGAFSADGTLLYCTETDVTHGRTGWLGVFDTTTFTRVGDLPTHGLAPHDCWLVDDGRTLVVGNGGGDRNEPAPPCVVWIDLATGTCRERRDQLDPRFDVGHLALTANGDCAVVSAPRLGTPDPTRARGGLVITRRDNHDIPIDGPDDIIDAMIGETLSIALHPPSGTLAVTNPEGHQLSFWSLTDGHSRGRLRIPSPRGVALTLGGDEFVVSFGQRGKLVRIDADTREPVDTPGNREGLGGGATGSHLLVHPIAPGI